MTVLMLSERLDTVPHSVPPPLPAHHESIALFFLSSLRFLYPLSAPVLFNFQHNGLSLYPSVRPRNWKRLEGRPQRPAFLAADAVFAVLFNEAVTNAR
jgi:hypothetical protein